MERGATDFETFDWLGGGKGSIDCGAMNDHVGFGAEEAARVTSYDVGGVILS